MINAMTTATALLFTLFLILGLVALRHWARHDGLSAPSRPAWFD